jgi:Fur family transcriptional regulator, ferric uptake regulator
MTTLEQFFTLLRSKNLKVTKNRTGIFMALSSAKSPLSVKEIHTMIEKKDTSNIFSLYRDLPLLMKKGIVTSVTFEDGIDRYELASSEHKHHLVCVECKNIDEIAMDHDLDSFEKKIAEEKKFVVKHHALEFYGLCAGCR